MMIEFILQKKRKNYNTNNSKKKHTNTHTNRVKFDTLCYLYTSDAKAIVET